MTVAYRSRQPVREFAAVSAPRRIWVTWERQRRNQTLSDALGAVLFEVIVPGGRVSRYLSSLRLTLGIFRAERPEVIFVQNPSMVLAAFAVVYGRLKRIPVVVDAHYAGIRPFEGAKPWANRLARFIARRALVVIVTTAGHAGLVASWGGRACVLQDPMPTFSEAEAEAVCLPGRRKVVFVCSWAADEPYDHVVAAARRLPADTYVYITGNPQGRDDRLRPLPENVVLTGYVSEARYLGLLRACDVVVDLTTREDCLVCGAYEALAMGKRLVTSGSRALREYFRAGALYTDNSAQDLAAKIMEAMQSEELPHAASDVHRQLVEEWARSKQGLESLLSGA